MKWALQPPPPPVGLLGQRPKLMITVARRMAVVAVFPGPGRWNNFLKGVIPAL